MPSPTNRIKQTGDTRDIAAFDIDDEVDGSGSQPEAAVFHPAASGIDVDAAPTRSAGYGWSDSDSGNDSQGGSGGGLRQRLSTRKYMEAAADQVRAQPMAALGGAFLLGFVLARLSR